MYFCILVLLARLALAYKDPYYLANRTTMVHLFEWKWNDVADECERFLGPRGYAGVQVSPVTENAIVPNRPWYERYQPLTYRLITRSGDEAEFRSMVKRCNDVGVRIYVDAVLNHMTAIRGSEVYGTGNNTANTVHYCYPGVPYTALDFHWPLCEVNNYHDAWNVRNCELVGLEDLNQTSEYVRSRIVNHLDELIEIGVAGFRIDAAKHMNPEDLAVIYSRLRNLNTEFGFPRGARPYIFQEVINLGYQAVSEHEYTPYGQVTEFKYGWEMSNVLRGHNALKWLISWGQGWGMMAPGDALVFIDNHDNQRVQHGPLMYKEEKLYKIAVALMLAHPYGTPRVMSSFEFTDHEQGPPANQKGELLPIEIRPDGNGCLGGRICEHRWPQIRSMVGFRNAVGDSALRNWWDNGNQQIAFCRGNAGFIAVNIDSVNLSRDFDVCLQSGTYCDVISGELVNGRCTGKSIVVGDHSRARIELKTTDENRVLAIHRWAKL